MHAMSLMFISMLFDDTMIDCYIITCHTLVNFIDYDNIVHSQTETI